MSVNAAFGVAAAGLATWVSIRPPCSACGFEGRALREQSRGSDETGAGDLRSAVSAGSGDPRRTAAGTAALSVGLGVPATNEYLLLSLLLAVATLDPDREVLLLVIPVKLKWLAYVEVALLAWRSVTLPGASKVFPLIALSNYLLFFGPGLWQALRARQRKATQVVETHRASQEPHVTRQRVCATCGVTDEDTVECWGSGYFLDCLDSMPRTGISMLAIGGRALGLPADTCFDGATRGW